MSEQPKDDKHWEQYRKPKGTEMKKTKPLIRILLGISLIMLITGLNQYFTDVMATKHIITTCIAVIILFFLFLTKMIRRDTLIPSLKDSLPYFTACFLIGSGGLVQVEWMVLVLAAIIFIADFAGDG
ncbi:uncharacterized protein METZ01_LOCUS494458 [marine metagenome]|jgi:hypothetical protein|uniref:Uncharacterized protein n=1 Tax=marine metagenome TaxID=408172 RepID=A0A383DB81_9ZZZZ